RALQDRLVEAPGHLREGGEEQVAEGVAGQGAVGEAVLEEPPHQRLVVGQGHEAVADVTGRQDAELAPQPAGRASVVRDGHDRGELHRGGLEPAEDGRETGASAERGDLAAAHAAASSSAGGRDGPRWTSRCSTVTSYPLSRYPSATASATRTLRWRPPVQPKPMTRCCFPSFS